MLTNLRRAFHENKHRSEQKMNIEALILKVVEENLSPVRYEIVNESHKHAGHAGDNGTGQTHFKLMIVSEVFTGQSRIERQKIMNAHLKGLFNEGLHAITYKLLTPSEDL